MADGFAAAGPLKFQSHDQESEEDEEPTVVASEPESTGGTMPYWAAYWSAGPTSARSSNPMLVLFNIVLGVLGRGLAFDPPGTG